MKLVSTSRMSRIDRDTQEQYHVPGMVLMEGAAIRCADLLEQTMGADHAGTVLFIVGKGNNGGDALAMARLTWIAGHFPVRIVISDATPGGSCGQQLASCAALGIPVTLFDGDPASVRTELARATWIVDGISGTGLSGALRAPLSHLVDAINEQGTPVFAVDTPSGVGDQYRKGFPAVHATVTATIGLPKSCLYLPHARPLCGRIVPVAISFPRELTEAQDIPGALLDSRDLAALLPPIDSSTYKTKRGYLALFAGASGTAGAAVLAATAATRVRTGLVALHIDEQAHAAAAAQCRSVMVRAWKPGTDTVAGTIPGPYTALAVGPGWGVGSDREGLLADLVNSGLPGVLDADGLNALASRRDQGKPDLAFGGRWVFTPHPGEFSRLTGIETTTILDDPYAAATRAAAEFEVCMVLKGHVTVIALPDGRYSVVDGMNPAMATGGSGDVLTGIIGGLLASGLPPEVAAVAGVLIHQEAGREAFSQFGWFAAEQLIEVLSRVLARYQRRD